MPLSASKSSDTILSALPYVSALRATGLDAHRENVLTQLSLPCSSAETKTQTQLTGSSGQEKMAQEMGLFVKDTYK